MLKIVALSDLHGQLIKITEPADIFIICGDISPLDIQWDMNAMNNWFNYVFCPWVKELPFIDGQSRCLLIGGNHDEYLYRLHRDTIITCDDRLIYIDNIEYIHVKEGKAYHMFGCPYCHELRGWPFCKPEDKLVKYYSFIPENLDVLILHDAPDILQGGLAVDFGNRDFGNKILAEKVKEVKPKVTLFGHIHSSPIHDLTEFEEGCRICNCSILGEDYKLRREPVVFELD